MKKINVTEYIRSAIEYFCGPDSIDHPAFDEAKKYNIETELSDDLIMPVRPWDFYKQLLAGRAVLLPRNGKISIELSPEIMGMDVEGIKMSEVRTPETIAQEVRNSAPLIQRLEQCRDRIAKMCSEGRPPKMTIPVQWYDDDEFICVTIQDAIAILEAIRGTLAHHENHG